MLNDIVWSTSSERSKQNRTEITIWPFWLRHQNGIFHLKKKKFWKEVKRRKKQEALIIQIDGGEPDRPVQTYPIN